MAAKASFIGLGAMGIPMARRLASAQNALKIYAWSRSPQSIAKLMESKQNNITACDTLNEAIDNTDYVMTCLPTSRDVQDTIAKYYKDGVSVRDERKLIWIDFTSGD